MKQFTLILGAIVLLLLSYVSLRSIQTLDSINARLNRANAEYQFVLSQDSITVFDNNRFVGTVRLEGQLDSLMIVDNE
jgi:sensor c-di-GMP phosphodiesterase-like protein